MPSCRALLCEAASEMLLLLLLEDELLGSSPVLALLLAQGAQALEIVQWVVADPSDQHVWVQVRWVGPLLGAAGRFVGGRLRAVGPNVHAMLVQMPRCSPSANT